MKEYYNCTIIKRSLQHLLIFICKRNKKIGKIASVKITKNGNIIVNSNFKIIHKYAKMGIIPNGKIAQKFLYLFQKYIKI